MSRTRRNLYIVVILSTCGVIDMIRLTDRIIRLIEADAAAKLAAFSTMYARARSPDREAIHAAIEIERWLMESCRGCFE